MGGKKQHTAPLAYMCRKASLSIKQQDQIVREGTGWGASCACGCRQKWRSGIYFSLCYFSNAQLLPHKLFNKPLFQELVKCRSLSGAQMLLFFSLKITATNAWKPHNPIKDSKAYDGQKKKKKYTNTYLLIIHTVFISACKRMRICDDQCWLWVRTRDPINCKAHLTAHTTIIHIQRWPHRFVCSSRAWVLWGVTQCFGTKLSSIHGGKNLSPFRWHCSWYFHGICWLLL